MQKDNTQYSQSKYVEVVGVNWVLPLQIRMDVVSVSHKITRRLWASKLMGMLMKKMNQLAGKSRNSTRRISKHQVKQDMMT